MMDSCRLMPTWIQSILSGLMIGVSTLLVPVVLYFLSYTIMVIQVVFILLLIQKNIIYRRISKIENAIKRKVIWIETKEDQKELIKKRIVNLLLVSVTVYLYFHLSNIKLLIINGLFCFLYFLKILFYVPVVSLRIIDEDGDVFQVINEKRKEHVELAVDKINEISLEANSLTIKSKEELVKIKIDFLSNKENEKVYQFLAKLNLFKGNKI